jgi:hypothetical protein
MYPPLFMKIVRPFECLPLLSWSICIPTRSWSQYRFFLLNLLPYRDHPTEFVRVILESFSFLKLHLWESVGASYSYATNDVFFAHFFVNEESFIWEIVSLRLSLRIVSQVTSWLFVNFQVSLINYQCFLVEDSSVLSRENVISISKGVKVHKSRD